MNSANRRRLPPEKGFNILFDALPVLPLPERGAVGERRALSEGPNRPLVSCDSLEQESRFSDLSLLLHFSERTDPDADCRNHLGNLFDGPRSQRQSPAFNADVTFDLGKYRATGTLIGAFVVPPTCLLRLTATPESPQSSRAHDPRLSRDPRAGGGLRTCVVPFS